MKIIDQHTKAIMEECKVRARDAGLSFDDESLEYIVSNQDMLELSPKGMIPTLYDYWVNDVETIKGKGQYKLYPHNPFETVINTRPAMSFYNDNNPDWLNIMIFYHVLGHIDFFQNNVLFKNTWNDDFAGQALADKRLIDSLRSEFGRQVDYAIEFCRSIDNLVGYFDKLFEDIQPIDINTSEKINFYFNEFLQEIAKAGSNEVYKEISRYNSLENEDENVLERTFFSEVKKKYPEFESKFKKFKETEKPKKKDIMQYIRDNSPFLKQENNEWISSVLNIVRNTSMYFNPQIRTKTINEGWASYWHDELFRSDDRISGHEVDYAKINASVTSISRVGYNPYAIGLRLIQYVEQLADKGRISHYFQKLNNIEARDKYDDGSKRGREALFELRKNFSDFTLITTFVDQDFIDEHNLFVVGQRENRQRGTIEYYVKSRKAEDYKQMLLSRQYHPPVIQVNEEKTKDNEIYIIHEFEGKPLYLPYIQDTMMAICWLWTGNPKKGVVRLETTELIRKRSQNGETEIAERRVLFTFHDNKISKTNI